METPVGSFSDFLMNSDFFDELLTTVCEVCEFKYDKQKLYIWPMTEMHFAFLFWVTVESMKSRNGIDMIFEGWCVYLNRSLT